ncbi:hypothetical protein [Pedobacter foliorum]|uniref:hypothetical protein n=1 Tax=Pedobacter foliorum TaxID=2739058 RepID=UPI0015635498|nr:hypothetical protein [Pedobacter foliorum]NRF41637.1 hypothetical protein [Pedobacter foliorum]
MADFRNPQRYFSLIHDIADQSESNNSNLTDLFGMLQKSDLDTRSVKLLKNETPDVIRENLNKSTLLKTFIKTRPSRLPNEYQVVRRETPLITDQITKNFSANAAANPTKTLGPFKAGDGRLFWFDFYKYEKLIRVFLSGESKPFMLIPLKLLLIQRSSTQYTLGKGSIWLRANLFTDKTGNTRYTGVKIKSGKITFNKSIQITGDSITITAQNTFTLDLSLDNTFQSTGTGSCGLDARISQVNLPETLTLNYAAKKITINSAGNSNWQVYGDQRAFAWLPGKAVTYAEEIDRLVIPIRTDVPDFAVQNCESGFSKIAGKAKVSAAAWCLALGELDVDKPFSIKNNGALVVMCQKGLSCKWQGIEERDQPIILNSPIILAEPGMINIHEYKANFNVITENYKLWQKNIQQPLRTEVTISFLNKSKLHYYALEEGVEGILALADTNFAVDKPIKADGTPASPTTKDSLYVKYITNTLSEVAILDLDMLNEEQAGDINSENIISKEKFTAFKGLPQKYQFAMSNAYLLTTPTAGVMLAGSFNSENIIIKGKLTTIYGLIDLIPTLPHPYTTKLKNTTRDRLTTYRNAEAYNRSLKGIVTSICDWDSTSEIPQDVTVDFKLQYNQANILPDTQIAFNDNSFALATRENNEIAMLGRRQDVFALLDLSTNYDLLGVSLSFNQMTVSSEWYANIQQTGEQVVTIEKMALRTPMALLNGFTLPHISWEPLVNLTKPEISADPPMGIVGYKDNGPATIFSQFDTKFIDIDPLKYIERFKSNLKSDSAETLHDEINPALLMKRRPIDKLQSSVLFGLPNGKISLAYIKPFVSDQSTVNTRHLDFIRPGFSLYNNQLKLKGALQFRLSADKPTNSTAPPTLKGFTAQLKNLTDENGDEISQSILGETVHKIFNKRFASGISLTGVPIEQIDFSGYGASMFSNWLNPAAMFADVTQVKFDVLIGRVSHEVVQVISILYPWAITVIRTITLYRRNNAIIYREDSGWIAKSDGTFDFSFEAPADASMNSAPFHNPYTFHPGLMSGLFNVHNIKEVEGDNLSFDYTPTEGDYYKNNQDDFVHKTGNGSKTTAEFVGVTFDANIKIENISSGETEGYVTGKQFKGYLQVQPSGVPISKEAFNNLMNKNQNSIGGSTDCTMDLGGSSQKLKINRVDVASSFQKNTPSDIIFVVAAKGSVQLPGDGSWSIVEVNKQSGEVQPVTNKLSVPVIRKGERDRLNGNFTLNNQSTISQIAFPDALLNNETSFPRRYGYVQNTGTQKLLLSDPRYDKNTPLKLITEAPLLADSFRLLNSKGPFPNLGNVLKIEDVLESATDIIPGGLSKAITGFPIPDHFEFDIIGKDGDAFRMYIKYKSEPKGGGTKGTVVDYVTDSAAGGDKWKNELSNMSIVVDLASFKSLMTISGDFKAKASANAGFDSGNAPQLKLAEPLEKIYQILEFLDNLDPTQPVEAIKKGLQIAMSNAADSWEYKFKASKEIPLVKFPFDSINYNSPTTPLKLDAYFKIGCYFNQPIKIPNTIEQIIPSAGAFLELGADLRVMCVSVAAATVYAVGRAEVGLAADLKNPPTLYFKFGFGIELAVGLPVIGSVAVMYMVGVDMSINSEVFTVGAFIYFRGRAEIFGGIVTITIQIEAAGKIEKPNTGPTSCIAMCTFALDISIFWVIDISFSETWEETRQIA